MTTFDALVEAAAEALDRSGQAGFTYESDARIILEAALAQVSEGGGTLTDTECEECLGSGEQYVPVFAPCPPCSGSGRQWQIGKLERVSQFQAGDAFFRFVPRSEGDET